MEQSEKVSASCDDLDILLSNILNVLDVYKNTELYSENSAEGIHSVALPITLRKRLLYNSSLN